MSERTAIVRAWHELLPKRAGRLRTGPADHALGARSCPQEAPGHKPRTVIKPAGSVPEYSGGYKAAPAGDCQPQHACDIEHARKRDPLVGSMKISTHRSITGSGRIGIERKEAGVCRRRGGKMFRLLPHYLTMCGGEAVNKRRSPFCCLALGSMTAIVKLD